MDDLIAFLRARIDEDEQAARNAGDVRPVWVYDRENFRVITAPGQRTLVSADGTPLPDRWIVAAGSPDRLFLDVNGAHIALHDPARVLAEVDAKRRIIDAYELATRAAVDDPLNDEAVFYAKGLERSVLLLALPHAGHPDYREEWRP